MSSVGEYHATPVTPPPTYKVTTRHGVSGVQVLDLTPILGDGGARLVRATLEGKSGGWHRSTSGAPGESVYELSVDDALPEGVSSLILEMRLADGVAEVTHRWKYQRTEIQSTTAAAAVPSLVRQAVEKIVGRSVNRVLMHTVADQLRTRIEAKIRNRQSLDVRQTLINQMKNQSQVQLLMRQRMEVGR